MVSWLYLFACSSSPAAGSSLLDWQFPSDANPAVPTVASNASGVATATIEVGFLGAGWLPGLAGLGTQTGLWDLGVQNPDDLGQDTRGRILLSIPSPGGTAGIGYVDLNLRVVQFVDEFFYTGGLTFSLPGVTLGSQMVVEPVPGQVGGAWVEDAFHWRLVPSPERVSLTITGAVGGTVLDRIRVDVVSGVSEVPRLVIMSVEKHSQVLSLSWAGGFPPYQIYGAASPLTNATWQEIGLPVSGTNAEIPLDGPVKFVRVRGSN